MRQKARVRLDQLLPSQKIALEEGERVWVELGKDMVWVYDNDGSASKTQGLLYTYGTKQEASKHLVLLISKE